MFFHVVYCTQVVFDAPTHVLKRSLHCLDDLQGKFEELFDPTEVRARGASVIYLCIYVFRAACSNSCILTRWNGLFTCVSLEAQAMRDFSRPEALVTIRAGDNC